MEANREQCELNLRFTSFSSEPRGLFLCVYCGRKFYNWQAFGGHQNAHKEERSLARRCWDIAAATRANTVSLSSSAPSLQDTARLGLDCTFVPAPKKARMEKQMERGRNSADAGDGLDRTLRL